MKVNAQILTLCPDCAEWYRERGLTCVPYKFKNATTEVKDRCQCCKAGSKGLEMYVTEKGV